MAHRLLCPFCQSASVQAVEDTIALAELECRACGKRWAGQKPRPAKILPRCPHCSETGTITRERVVMGNAVRDSHTCSHCGASWPVDAGGRSSA